jgi:Sel1 repeat
MELYFNPKIRKSSYYLTLPKWWRLGTDQSNVIAQYNLGSMYANGQGVPQDYAEAAKWYRLAADQGLAIAQFVLGVMYNKGDGVPHDYAEAVKWAMAASVACKVGLWALNKKPRHLKAHGRPARSLFALGLDTLRKLFAPRSFMQSLQVLLDFLFGNPKQNSTQSRGYA